MHPVESEMLCSLVAPTKIPYFNAPIYLENKTQIGKVDEILGPINEVFFTVKMEQGMVASSFKKEDKVYIGGDKLLPIERFLPKPKGTVESESRMRRSSDRVLGADAVLQRRLVVVVDEEAHAEVEVGHPCAAAGVEPVEDEVALATVEGVEVDEVASCQEAHHEVEVGAVGGSGVDEGATSHRQADRCIVYAR